MTRNFETRSKLWTRILDAETEEFFGVYTFSQGKKHGFEGIAANGKYVTAPTLKELVQLFGMDEFEAEQFMNT